MRNIDTRLEQTVELNDELPDDPTDDDMNAYFEALGDIWGVDIDEQADISDSSLTDYLVNWDPDDDRDDGIDALNMFAQDRDDHAELQGFHSQFLGGPIDGPESDTGLFGGFGPVDRGPDYQNEAALSTFAAKALGVTPMEYRDLLSPGTDVEDPRNVLTEDGQIPPLKTSFDLDDGVRAKDSPLERAARFVAGDKVFVGGEPVGSAGDMSFDVENNLGEDPSAEKPSDSAMSDDGGYTNQEEYDEQTRLTRTVTLPDSGGRVKVEVAPPMTVAWSVASNGGLSTSGVDGAMSTVRIIKNVVAPRVLRPQGAYWDEPDEDTPETERFDLSTLTVADTNALVEAVTTPEDQWSDPSAEKASDSPLWRFVPDRYEDRLKSTAATAGPTAAQYIRRGSYLLKNMASLARYKLQERRR